MQFSQLGISNTLLGKDYTNPVLSTVVVTNLTPNVLALTYTDVHNLDESKIPDNLDYSISGAVNNPTITAVVIDGTAKIVYLFLSANILSDDVPLLTYVQPDPSIAVQDVSGNLAASFSNHAVTNDVATLPVFSGNANLLWLFNSFGLSGSTVEDKSGNNLDGALVKSHCLTSDGTLVFTFSSLAGITITSSAGTSTPTIVSNTITTTSGTIFNILLSNGTRLACAEGAGSITYDAVNSLDATLSGTVDWTATQDTYHYNILNGMSYLGRIPTSGGYITLTANMAFSTGKFDVEIIYAPDAITTVQDILGTTTTSNRLELATSAGAMGGTLRLGSGTTYTLTCASNAATVGYANNTFCTIRFTRTATGIVTLTVNGFTMLIDGAAFVTDTSSTVFSQLCRTSTSASNVGTLKSVRIIDSSVAADVGKVYNADNGFRGTANGSFISVKYPKPQKGDSTNTNPAGNWHNAAETVLKPNPSNDSGITTASGWTSSTELTYAQLDSVADPAFCDVTNPKRKKNLVLWTTALPYEDELVANNFVGKTTININSVTGWSTSNRLAASVGSSYQATTSCTMKLVVRPSGSLYTTAQPIFGKTDSIGGNDWAFEGTANADGDDFTFRVRDGSNAVVKSRNITFIEKDTELCIILAGIRPDGVGGYEIWIAKDGSVENTVVPIVGITGSTSDLFIGCFSSGNPFAGGIVAAAFGTVALTDNEIEASYQQTKNNVYVEESWMTFLFGSESGNANWVDRIGGSLTLTKSGTLTATAVNQAFNKRWRPEDWPSDTVPLALTPLPTPDVMMYGDSRVNGSFSENTVGFRQLFRDLADLDGDISGLTMVGSEGSAPINHYGVNGKDSSTLISLAPGILTVNTTYNPDICIVMNGVNAMTTNTLLDREIDEYESLLFSFIRDLGTDTRIVLLSETEHNYAHRRARQQYLMDNRCRVLIPKLREKGYHIIWVNQWRTIKNMDGDFIVEAGDPLVHPNDQGNGKLVGDIFTATKLAAAYTP